MNNYSGYTKFNSKYFRFRSQGLIPVAQNQKFLKLWRDFKKFLTSNFKTFHKFVLINENFISGHRVTCLSLSLDLAFE